MHTKERLVLNYVDRTLYNSCLDVLNSNFTSPMLQNMVDSLRRWLSDKKTVYVSDEGEVTTCLPVSTYFIMKSHSKDDALKFLAVFLADADNCTLMVNSFPNIIREVLLRCIEECFVPVNEISHHKDVNRLFSKSEDWGNSRYEVCCPWFSLVSQKNNRDCGTFIRIENSLYPYFYRALHRFNENKGGMELPTGEHLQMLKTEASVIRVFPLLRDLYDMGELEAGSKGKISIATVKRCAQQLGPFEEFFPNAKESTLKNFRASLLFAYMYYRFSNFYLRSSKREIPVEKLLKDVLNTLLPVPKLLIQDIIPHITGSFASLEMTNAHYLLLDILKDIIINTKSEEESRWISIEEFIEHILAKDHGYVHFLLFSKYDYNNDNIAIKNTKFDKRIISLSRLRTEVIVPYIKGIFLMMASAGLFDIAYRAYLEEDCSWVDWLKYVRITNLGRYVLGISNEYCPKEESVNVDFCEIGEEHLVVRSLVDKNPYALYLEDVAKFIGNHRYIITEESFIKKCFTRKDVESKIDYFKNHISSELPPIWENFFADILQRCNPFVSLRPMEYSMFQVEPENKALIHLLSTDAVLKKMVIRAEGFVFMVKNCDIKKFNERMKSCGYIV